MNNRRIKRLKKRTDQEKKDVQNDHCSLVKKEGEEELKSEVFTFKLDFAKDVKKMKWTLQEDMENFQNSDNKTSDIFLYSRRKS